jgi:tripartite-type tricarboxylate transporter receptor subunit TctC
MVQVSFAGCVRAAVALASTLTALPATAASVADFYSGKTLTFIVGADAGGSYDLNARTVATYFVRHLPGHPTAVVQNMPGAGSMRMANAVYTTAPKDGTVIGAAQRLVPFGPLFGEQAAKYDARKMHWLGSTAKEVAIFAVWHTSRQRTAHDLFTRETIVGGTQPGTDTVLYANVLNNVLGTKLRIVSGYSSSIPILLAMERGEVEGIANWSWSDVGNTRPTWIPEKKIRVLMQLGLTKHPDLPDVPLVMDFAKNAEQRQLLEVLMGMKDLGRPFFVAPEVADDRVTALEAAFLATMADKDFLAESKRVKRDIDPVSGAEMHEILDRAYALSPDMVAKARAAVSAAPAK